MFALGLPGGRPVFVLPPGRLADGVHHADERNGFRVADDLDGFLELLRSELEEWAAAGRPPTFF